MEEQIQEIVFNPFAQKMAIIILCILVIWLLRKTVQKRVFSKIKDNDSRYKAKKISVFFAYLLIIILIAVVFSDKLSGVTVALGVAGAGIAFALQEVIVSFAGWLTILFGGFYKTGDRVQLGGIKGDVMDIGMLRTTIMETGEWVDGDLYNGRIVLVANSFVFKEPVYNYSGEFPFLWDEIKVPIQFGSDYEKTKEILLATGADIAGVLPESSRLKWSELQNKYRLEDAQTNPIVSVTMNDNWVEFTLRYIVDYKKRRSTKTALFLHILKDVEGSQGSIKFASATFHLVEAPELKVKLNQEKT